MPGGKVRHRPVLLLRPAGGLNKKAAPACMKMHTGTAWSFRIRVDKSVFLYHFLWPHRLVELLRREKVQGEHRLF